MVVNMNQTLDDIKKHIIYLIDMFENFGYIKNIFEYVSEKELEAELKKLYRIKNLTEYLLSISYLFFE